MAQVFGLGLLFMDSHGVSPEAVHRSEMGSLMLGWPKNLFGFLHTILRKNPGELFGQPSVSCGLPWWPSGKESTCQHGRPGFDPRLRKTHGRKKEQLIPIFLSDMGQG